MSATTASDPEHTLVAALLAGDAQRGEELLQRWPALAADSPAVGLCMARPDVAGRFTEDTADQDLGPLDWPPLLYLCSSRFAADEADEEGTRDRQVAIARQLVALGANPSAGIREAETIRGYRTALGAAIGCARNPALAEWLVEAGADVADGPTLYEGCAMWYAVRERDIASLRVLLDAEPPQWHVCHALPHALRYNDEELTRLLLESGGDPNWTMGIWGCKGNCLHEAAMLDNDPAVVEALLAHGAQVDFRDRDGRSPLAVAVCLNRHALAALLRAHGAKEDAVRDVDRWVGACMAGDAEEARRLAALFADAESLRVLADDATSAEDKRKARARLAPQFRQTDHLWVCRAVGRVAGDPPPALRIVRNEALALLLAGGLNPSAADDDGECALHLAALGNAEAVSTLVAHGADANAPNFANLCPDEIAFARGDRELGLALMVARRGLVRPLPGPELADAFERAADAVVDGDLATLRALLRKHSLLAYARSQRPHRCTLLNYLGANGFEHWRQRTPANALAVIHTLIRAGCNPNALCYTYRGGPGENTLGLLTSSHHPKEAGLMLPMVAALAGSGAKVDATYALLARLHHARQPWQGGLAQAARRLDVAARLSALALVEAAMLGEAEIVFALADAGVDLNARRDDGATALHQAAFDGNADLVEALLERGADLRLRDNVFDGTAAGWAFAGGYEELGSALQRRLAQQNEGG